jgi:Putative peptidoglycan binding domain
MAIEKVQLQLNDGIDTPHLSDEVEILQKRLKDWGVLPKDARIDGKFGDITKAAVERFQSLRPADPTRSKFVRGGLTINGIVDKNTWAELLKVNPTEITILSRTAPSTTVPAGFPSVDTILSEAKVPASLHRRARLTIPVILNECVASGVSDRAQIAYILATAEHESLLGELMVELADGLAYDPVSELATELGNDTAGDGPFYKGRGFVQITGRRNYTDWTNRLDIDLVNHPEKATLPNVAAKVLVRGMKDGTFTSFRLGEFIAGTSIDFVKARRIVNGDNRADHIAEIASFYHKALT